MGFFFSSILEILIECFELLLESPSEILSDFYEFEYFKLFNMLSTIQIIFWIFKIVWVKTWSKKRSLKKKKKKKEKNKKKKNWEKYVNKDIWPTIY